MQRAALAAPAREAPAETLLRRLAMVTPQEIDESLGEELTGRLASRVRMVAKPPMCWLPLFNAYAPRISQGMSDAEIVAAAARRLADRLKRHLDRWYWTADLYGTVTPSQFVDRLGTMLVKSSFRPAYRTALFGGLFLVMRLIIGRIEKLGAIDTFLDRVVATPLMVLGGVCFVVLGIGWWLKRMAREATEFYERAAQAQFLPLTEIIRGRHVARVARVIENRVLGPEARLRQAARRRVRPRHRPNAAADGALFAARCARRC